MRAFFLNLAFLGLRLTASGYFQSTSYDERECTLRVRAVRGALKKPYFFCFLVFHVVVITYIFAPIWLAAQRLKTSPVCIFNQSGVKQQKRRFSGSIRQSSLLKSNTTTNMFVYFSQKIQRVLVPLFWCKNEDGARKCALKN